MKSLTPILVVLISVFMYFFYIVPMADNVKLLAQKNSEYKSIIQQAKDLTIKRDDLLQKYNDLTQEDVDKLNKSIPTKFDSVVFVNDMTALASQNQVLIDSFNISDNRSDAREENTGEEQPLYRTTTVSFKITGQYTDVLSFLNNLERSLRIIDVIGIEVSIIDSVKANSPVDVLLKINTYSLK